MELAVCATRVFLMMVLSRVITLLYKQTKARFCGMRLWGFASSASYSCERSLYSPEPAPSLKRYKLPNQLPLYTLRLGAIFQLDLRPKESFTSPPTSLVRPSAAVSLPACAFVTPRKHAQITPRSQACILPLLDHLGPFISAKH